MNTYPVRFTPFHPSMLLGLILVLLLAGCDESGEPKTNRSLQGLWIIDTTYGFREPYIDWFEFLSFEGDSVSFSTYHRYSPYTIRNDTIRIHVRSYDEPQGALTVIFRVIKQTEDSLWLTRDREYTSNTDTLRFYQARSIGNQGTSFERVILRTTFVGRLLGRVNYPLMRIEIDSTGLLYYTRCFQGRDSCIAYMSTDAQHLFRELVLRLRLADIDNTRERFHRFHGPEYYLRIYHNGRRIDLHLQGFDGVLGSVITLLMDIPQRVPLRSLKESHTFEADTLWPFRTGFLP